MRNTKRLRWLASGACRSWLLLGNFTKKRYIIITSHHTISLCNEDQEKSSFMDLILRLSPSKKNLALDKWFLTSMKFYKRKRKKAKRVIFLGLDLFCYICWPLSVMTSHYVMIFTKFQTTSISKSWGIRMWILMRNCKTAWRE